MNLVPTNFVEFVIWGAVEAKDLDSYIEEWHEKEINMPLFAYLGFTEEEFKSVVQTDNVQENLKQIIKMRMN